MPFKEKSIKLNMFFNAVKSLLSIAFPLITFPYVSHVLGVNNLGQFNFSVSIINWFILLAGLGLGTYAIREGAKLRNNEKQFKVFSDSIFTINILSTILSYVIFLILLVAVPKLQNYETLLLILSLQIMFKTIGVEWIFSIFEDYLYITIVSIVFQCISFVLLFLLVQNENDIYFYACITVFSAVGSNVINYFYARKYYRPILAFKPNIKKHLKPVLTLFAISVTVMVYVSSDVIILGFLCDDYTVGIYSVSIKIYSTLKMILSSILVVSIPRLSALLNEGENNAHYNRLASDIYSTLLSILFPVIVLIILLRNDIILLISGASYIQASSSVTLLSIALFFCLGAWFWAQCILVPNRIESAVFKITIITAVVNIVFNFILIPIWKENAAAFTTIIAEAIAFFWCWFKGRIYVSLQDCFSVFIKVLIGVMGMVITFFILDTFSLAYIYRLIISVISLISVYVFIEIKLKNSSIYSVMLIIKKRIPKMS